MLRFSTVVLLCVLVLTPAGVAQTGVPQKQADGIVVPLHEGFLKIAVGADNIVRVAFAKDGSFFEHKSLATVAPSGRFPPGS